MNYGDGDYGALINPGQESYNPPEIPQEDIPASKLRFYTDQLYTAHLFPAGASAANEYALFVTALRAAGQGFVQPMSVLHTNLVQPGQIPYGSAWQVFKVGVGFAPGGDPNDNLTFLRHVALIFRKGAGDYERAIGPAVFEPGGFGVAGVAATSLPVTDIREVANGIPAISAMWDFGEAPIILTAGEAFGFSFRAIDYALTGLPARNAEQIVYLRLIGRAIRRVEQ